MKILAIETSCDETAIAIVKAQQQRKATQKDFEILSNIVASQVEIHEKYGGIYPTLAKREHQRNLAPVLKQSLNEARLLKSMPNKDPCLAGRQEKSKLQTKIKKLKEILKREETLYKQLREFLLKYQKPKIAAIAVTAGPGLEPCLWEGVNFAKALGFFWDLPVIPVNHLEGHIIANFVGEDRESLIVNRESSIFPAIALLVSGGHTQLVLVKEIGDYKIIGETRDDAAGECFDKTARILGLGYPGGPEIEQQAAQKKKKSSDLQTSNFKLRLPRPMINQKNYDFSFSGLKTAVLYKVRSRKHEVRRKKKYIQSMAAEIQQAIIEVLVKKTIKAAKDFKAKTIILGGGVAANKALRKQLKEKIKKELPDTCYLSPDISLCTDNGVMIGVTAFFHLDEKQNWQKIKANANMRL